MKKILLVLTGGMGSGKSTIKKELVKRMSAIGVIPREIYSKNDLYIPFAQQMGILEESFDNSRAQMTRVMEHLYTAYGEELGTRLLVEKISHESDNVYIIDSKRNPTGIAHLKREADLDVCVIGVDAYVTERAKRVAARDHISESLAFNQILEEEKVFSISQSLQLSDIIVENNGDPIHVLVQDVFIAVYERLFLPGAAHQHIALPPKQNENSSPMCEETWDYVASTEKVVSLLKKEKVSSVVVVQGGNAFLSHIVRDCGVVVFDMKLSSLTKVPLATLLNTALTPHERTQKMSKEFVSWIRLFSEESPRVRAILHAVLEAFPVYDIDNLCIVSRAQFVRSMCAHIEIDIPFSEPSNPALFDDERAQLARALCTQLIPVDIAQLCVRMCAGTAVGEYFAGQEKKYFIDDCLYRGRTLFTCKVVADLFACKEFMLVTLASEGRIPEGLRTYVTVINEGSAYPYENSVRTEGHYWDQRAEYFKKCDLSVYGSYLLHGHADNIREGEVYQAWVRVVQEYVQAVGCTYVPWLTDSLIFSFLQAKCLFGSEQSVAAFADTRPSAQGYSAAYACFMSHFINQAASASERGVFKEYIRSLLVTVMNGPIGALQSVVLRGDSQYAIEREYYRHVFLDTSTTRKEVEKKYALRSLNEAKSLCEALRHSGFMYQGSSIETDLSPDTSDFALRALGLLYRIRWVYPGTSSPYMLVTLKIKGTRDEYKSDDELEYRVGADHSQSTYADMCDIFSAHDVRLPPFIKTPSDVQSVETELRLVGFTSVRMMLEKRRSEFSLGRSKVLIDTLSNGLGTYVEIEGHSLDDVLRVESLLGIDPESYCPMDYGEIVVTSLSTKDREVRRALYEGVHIPELALFSTGPNTSLNSLGAIPHRSMHFSAVYAQVRSLVTEYVTTFPEFYDTVPMTGSGTQANELFWQSMAVSAVLVLVQGEFGRRLEGILKRAGHDVVCVASEEEFMQAMRTHHYAWVALVHHETSTGYVLDLEMLCRSARAQGARVFVDGVSSVGIEYVDMCVQHIDALTTVSGKALMAESGIFFLTYVRDIERMFVMREHGPASLQMCSILPYHEKNQCQHTPNTKHFYDVMQTLLVIRKHIYELRSTRSAQMQQIIETFAVHGVRPYTSGSRAACANATFVLPAEAIVLFKELCDSEDIVPYFPRIKNAVQLACYGRVDDTAVMRMCSIIDHVLGVYGEVK